MRLKVKILKFMAGRPIAILNEATAQKINVHVGERVLLGTNGHSLVTLIDTAKGLLAPSEIAVSNEIIEHFKLKENDFLEVSLVGKPESVRFIKKKMDKHILSKEEIYSIIRDIVDNSLSEVEIAYFVSAVYTAGMNDTEIENLIMAMVSTGKQLSFPGKVVDKHSIGGIAANRTTPLVVSICACKNLMMPKTSSRAITSAAGTADVIEAIADIEFTPTQIKDIVNKTNGCMVWGGSLGLSPADDKLIQVERVLSLDPEAQLLASVLSKKISVGSKYVIIDIPFGKSAKVSKEEGLKLKKQFEKFGSRFGLKLKCVLTDGKEPIGKGVGPLLEIRDIIKVLKRTEDRPLDLENKSIFLAGQILELAGECKEGRGEATARVILDSGDALAKFEEIIKAQNGHVPTADELENRLGKLKVNIVAEKNGKITGIDNKKINLLAHLAGSPMDKGCGIYLYKHIGEKVKLGDKIATIYAESQTRLNNATNLFDQLKPIV